MLCRAYYRYYYYCLFFFLGVLVAVYFFLYGYSRLYFRYIITFLSLIRSVFRLIAMFFFIMCLSL